MLKNKPKTKVITWFKSLLALFALIISSSLIGGSSFASPSAEGIQVYQKNVHTSPEHKQRLADDISRYHHADNLWDVLREEFTLPHYEDNPLVQEKIDWYMNNQDYLLRSASRAAPYLYYILQQVKKRHLPAELVLLPIVESGYNPFNRSPMGAAGIWQLMPGTASGLGIKQQDSWYDGRRDVIASTRAALNYLAYLQNFFEGNWLYAIAAYNTGEGNLLSAIKKNIRNGRDTDFWSLPVAQETKDYVPSLLALAVIISHPQEYPIYFPPVRNAPYLAQIDTGSKINLKYAASLAGISHQKLMQLNPGFPRTATSTKLAYKLVLPIENVEQFTENLAHSPLSNKIHWVHYKVKSGDTLASIAKKFKLTTADIRNMNHLNKNGLQQGSNLLLPYQASTAALEEVLDEVAANENESNSELIKEEKHPTRKEPVAPILSIKNYTLQPGDTIYMVRKKDTLASIAKRFHVNPIKLLAANNIRSNKIKPGKQLIIPTHSNSQVIDKTNRVQPGDTLYMIRRGDTVEKIARKFNSTPAAIRLANLIDNDNLIVGEKLIVPTHIKG